MNMSEDVVNSTVQLTMKAAETGSRLLEKSIDLIAKLLQFLQSRGASKSAQLKSTDLTDIKPGAVDMKTLIGNCRKSGDAVCSSEQSVTKADMMQIAKKAREYGIPVAFTGTKGKDNIYANVRKSDADIFKNICTDLMRDKLAERPQELGNFKVQQWEIPFITAELNQHDLSAQFGKTKDGENFCLFEKTDEKAIRIARDEFVRKCGEIEKEINIEQDQNGYYAIKDNRSGKEITFDTLPTRAQLSDKLQTEFGYDAGKADIVCAKFGQEQLTGADRSHYFSDDPQQEFSKIDSNIKLKGESILAKPYTCWRLTPKTDSTPSLVFQNEQGQFCVLHPERMTRKQMAERLQTDLNIQDPETVRALTDKAIGVNDYYQKQDLQNFSHQKQFAMDKDENGNFTLKELKSGIEKPVETKTISTDIKRTGKSSFTVTGSDNRTLYLSLSNKKTAIQHLKEMLQEQGVPEESAKSMAKEIFRKAESQSAEQVLSIEEIKMKQPVQNAEQPEKLLTVRYGNQTKEFDINDRDQAVKEISEHFGLQEACAAAVLEMAEEKLEEHFDENDEKLPEHDDKQIDPDKKQSLEKPDISVKPELEKPDLQANADSAKLPEIPAARSVR